MPTKFDVSRKDVLVSSDRRLKLDPVRVISSLPIMPYHKVADVGCGPGFFTIPLAKYLFDGKLYAFDVQDEMLEATQEGLDAARLTNVEVAKSKETKLPMDDETLDGVFIAFVLQEASRPKALLKDVLRCLKPLGWLTVLEWNKVDTNGGPPVEQRIEELELREMAEEQGFRFRNNQSLNDGQYMHYYKK